MPNAKIDAFSSATRKHVQHAEQRILIALEKAAQVLGVDTGNRDMTPHPIDGQHPDGEQYTTP